MLVEMVLPVIVVGGDQVGIKDPRPFVARGQEDLYGIGDGALDARIRQLERGLLHIRVRRLPAGDPDDGRPHLPKIEGVMESRAECLAVCQHINVGRRVKGLPAQGPQARLVGTHAALHKRLARRLDRRLPILPLVVAERVIAQGVTCLIALVIRLQAHVDFPQIEGRDQLVIVRPHVCPQIPVAKQLIQGRLDDGRETAAIAPQVDDERRGLPRLHGAQHIGENRRERGQFPNRRQRVGRELTVHIVPVIIGQLRIESPPVPVHVLKIIARVDRLDPDIHHLPGIVEEAIRQVATRDGGGVWQRGDPGEGPPPPRGVDKRQAQGDSLLAGRQQVERDRVGAPGEQWPGEGACPHAEGQPIILVVAVLARVMPAHESQQLLHPQAVHAQQPAAEQRLMPDGKRAHDQAVRDAFEVDRDDPPGLERGGEVAQGRMAVSQVGKESHRPLPEILRRGAGLRPQAVPHLVGFLVEEHLPAEAAVGIRVGRLERLDQIVEIRDQRIHGQRIRDQALARAGHPDWRDQR